MASGHYCFWSWFFYRDMFLTLNAMMRSCSTWRMLQKSTNSLILSTRNLRYEWIDEHYHELPHGSHTPHYLTPHHTALHYATPHCNTPLYTMHITSHYTTAKCRAKSGWKVWTVIFMREQHFHSKWNIFFSLPRPKKCAISLWMHSLSNHPRDCCTTNFFLKVSLWI